MKNIKVQKKKSRHLAVTAAILDKKGRFLLTQRNEPKWTHSHKKWQFPGGGIKYGENPENAVLREVKEETGINIKLLTKEPFIHSFVFEKENIHVLLLTYPALYLSGKLDISKDRYTGNAKWFLPDKIDFSICMPEVKNMITKVKNT